MVKIVATTSLPVDRLTVTNCSADAHAHAKKRKKGKEKNGENSGSLMLF